MAERCQVGSLRIDLAPALSARNQQASTFLKSLSLTHAARRSPTLPLPIPAHAARKTPARWAALVKAKQKHRPNRFGKRIRSIATLNCSSSAGQLCAPFWLLVRCGTARESAGFFIL
jgi:hypothetical protein